MGLNKQNGDMYEWITHTWNPLAGACPHACIYCSTKTLTARYEILREKYSGQPRFCESEKTTKLGSGRTIFVANMVDLFAEAVPSEVISEVLSICRNFPGNLYLFQSKNPYRFLKFAAQYPWQVIFCTTIESDINHHASKAPMPDARASAMMKVKQRFPAAKISATIEPIMRFTPDFVTMLRYIAPDFVSIGADSKRSNLPEPTASEVSTLVEELKTFTKVEKKRNLERLT